MIKGIMVAIALLSIGACTSIPQVNAAREVLKSEGAKSSDQLLEDAVWVVCRGSSVGAIVRYFRTRELADAWLAICNNVPEASIFDAT